MSTFNTKAAPTFQGSITIIGQGREQKLEGTMKHMSSDAYGQLFAGLANGTIKPEQAILDIFEQWNADRPLTPDGVREVLQDMPGFDWAVVTGYGDALTVARKGNL